MADINWYLNRLKKMSIKEVVHRSKCKVYDNKIKNGYRLLEEKYEARFIKLPRNYNLESEKKEEFLNQCDLILNDKIIIFDNIITMDYDNKFLVDPFTRDAWSKSIYSKVSFRKSNLKNDPKVIWEINKQQYLFDLGFAYQLTRDDKYAKKVLIEIEEWINQNPLYMGINWTSGLEISLRALCWMYSLSLTKDYISKNDIDINNILHYIRVKTEFIFNKLSLHSSANNHLIGELTLLLYSSYFIECDEAYKWRSKSMKMLQEQINNQFYCDGINKEQSINYQIHTMEMYFLCEYLLNLNNTTLGNQVISTLKKACDYISGLSEKDGLIFNIGDEDGGHIIRVQNHCQSVLDILQLGSLVLKEKKIYENKIKKFDLKVFILFGSKYNEFMNNNSFIERNYSTQIFQQGGVYVRDGSINDIKYKVMLDFGNIGMEPLNAHAHCDILSINMNINEKPFLIDCGTYKYHQDEGFRNYFRGVKAHNTISINENNHFEFLGPFLCGTSPQTKIKSINEDSIECISNVYKNIGCLIGRKLLFSDEVIYIEDEIINENKEEIYVTRYYNFDNNVKCLINNNICECEIEGIKLKLKFDKDSKLKLSTGWQSTRFYHKVECNLLEVVDIVNAKSTNKLTCELIR